MMEVKVIGAGLAGSEAAWQLASRGIKVKLYEMRPTKMTPAHKTSGFAELICSNSLRAASIQNAIGLLKEEMRELGSIIMEAADNTKVEAGGALAVDRDLFSKYVTEKIRSNPNIEVIEEEVLEIPEGPTIIASGPLTSEGFSEKIKEFFKSHDKIKDKSEIQEFLAYIGMEEFNKEEEINFVWDSLMKYKDINNQISFTGAFNGIRDLFNCKDDFANLINDREEELISKFSELSLVQLYQVKNAFDLLGIKDKEKECITRQDIEDLLNNFEDIFNNSLYPS